MQDTGKTNMHHQAKSLVTYSRSKKNDTRTTHGNLIIFKTTLRVNARDYLRTRIVGMRDARR